MTAKIKIGGVLGSRALASTSLGVPQTFSNNDNAGVLGWKWEWLDTPQISLTLDPPPVPSFGSTLIVTPDVLGWSIKIRLTTYSDVGRTVIDAVDEVVLGIRFPLPNDFLIPCAGETTQFDLVKGWSREVNRILAKAAVLGAIDGRAGGDLTGSYPNPTIALGAVTDLKVAAANKDGVAGTPSLRTLGTGAQEAAPGNIRLDQVAVPTAPVSLNSERLTNVADPLNPQDAVTKAYADAVAVGLSPRGSVRAVSTTNVAALTGLAVTVDGVALDTDGYRVGLVGQTSGVQNGIWVVHAGAWTRAADLDTGSHAKGASFFVEQGTVFGSSSWVCTTAGPTDVVATNPLTFAQISAAGTVLAGTSLTKVGNTISVTAGGITDVQVAAANKDGAAGTPSMRTLGPGAAQAAPGNDARIVGALQTTGGTMSGPIAMGAHPITGVSDPSDPQDAATKAYVDAEVSIPPARTLTAGAGLTGGGDLTADRVFNVVADADGSIVVAADSIKVGVLATDAQHGVRGGDTQHALAVPAGAAGFFSGADKAKLDGMPPDPLSRSGGTMTGPIAMGSRPITGLPNPTSPQDPATKAYVDAGVSIPPTRVLTAGAGMSGGGDLTADRSFEINNLDGSIVVHADDIGVGVLATDAQHGVRGGGTQHAIATESVPGFMSAADKTKLDGIGPSIPLTRVLTAGAGMTGGGDLTADRTFDVAGNPDGSIVVNANDVQVGVLATDAQHGVRGGGTQHALVVPAGAAGFMGGTDKTKLDGIPADALSRSGGTMTGPIAMGAHPITGLADPTNPQDAATKAYVDAVAVGLNPKGSVRAVSTANVAVLVGLITTVDGVALDTDGYRVGLVGQTLAVQNGIWVVHAGVWTRALDLPSGQHADGAFFFVEQGTVFGSSGWVGTGSPDVVGTDPLTFTQISAAGSVLAGTSLTKVGNTISVTAGGITDVQVAAANKDGTAGTPSMRTLGPGAQQAAPGTLSLRALTAGAGLTGGGDLTADRVFNVGANADGSIVVHADDIGVGVLATDAQHGVRGGGTQHALAVPAGAAGFFSGADKAKLDGISPGALSPTRVLTAGAGLTGGGDLTADRVFNVVANADGSIVVHADDVGVGVLATDAQHGVRGGGTQHAIATSAVPGFLSAADKLKLDGLSATVGATFSGTRDAYVSSGGNDANPGTSVSQWLTLAPVIADLARYSCFAADATYRVWITGSSGFSPAWIRIRDIYLGDNAVLAFIGGSDDQLLGSHVMQAGTASLATDLVTAAGSTLNTKIVTTGGLGVNTYRGKTLRVTSGAALGLRATIREHNDATIWLCSPEYGYTGSLPASITNTAIAVGDTFDIVEPSCGVTCDVVTGSDTMASHVSGDIKTVSAPAIGAAMIFVNLKIASNSPIVLVGSAVRLVGVSSAANITGLGGSLIVSGPIDIVNPGQFPARTFAQRLGFAANAGPPGSQSPPAFPASYANYLWQPWFCNLTGLIRTQAGSQSILNGILGAVASTGQGSYGIGADLLLVFGVVESYLYVTQHNTIRTNGNLRIEGGGGPLNACVSAERGGRMLLAGVGLKATAANAAGLRAGPGGTIFTQVSIGGASGNGEVSGSSANGPGIFCDASGVVICANKPDVTGAAGADIAMPNGLKLLIGDVFSGAVGDGISTPDGARIVQTG